MPATPVGGTRRNPTGAPGLTAIAWWIASRSPLFPHFPTMTTHLHTARTLHTQPSRLPVPVGRHPGLLPFGNSAFGTPHHTSGRPHVRPAAADTNLAARPEDRSTQIRFRMSCHRPIYHPIPRIWMWQRCFLPLRLASKTMSTALRCSSAAAPAHHLHTLTALDVQVSASRDVKLFDVEC